MSELLTRRLLGRLVGGIALLVVGILVLAGLAPFALDERRTSGAVADSAVALPGQAQAATEGLRRLGFTCSDADASPAVLRRVCTRSRFIHYAQVDLLVTASTGAVQRVTTTLDEGRSTQASHRQILEVLTDAVGLTPAERSRVTESVDAGDQQSLAFGWGAFTLRPGAGAQFERSVDQWESELRAAGWDGAPPSPSTTTLAASVDDLAAAARSHGYDCRTPEVPTYRSCHREEGGYSFELAFDGTDAFTASLYLSVGASYRTDTRGRWVNEMGHALTWIDTEQARDLSRWLAQSAEAPGGDGYVNGLRIGFTVRSDDYTKETFGGVTAPCAEYVGELAACEAGSTS